MDIWKAKKPSCAAKTGTKVIRQTCQAVQETKKRKEIREEAKSYPQAQKQACQEVQKTYRVYSILDCKQILKPYQNSLHLSVSMGAQPNNVCF